MSRRIYIVNKSSGEVRAIYDDIFSTAAALGGVRVDKVRGWLDNLSLPCERIYVPRYEEDYDPNESYAGKINRPVVVVDSLTGRMVCAPGVRSAMSFTQGSKSSVERGCRSGTPVCDRYYVRPLDFMGQGFKPDTPIYKWNRTAEETLKWCSRGRWSQTQTQNK